MKTTPRKIKKIMKRRLLFFLSLFILSTLGFFACQSEPTAHTTAFPTPIVLDDILDSSRISAISEPLCPDEEEYRRRPADYYEKGWERTLAHPPVSTGAGINMTSISDGINIGMATYEVPDGKTISLTYRYMYLGAGDTLPLPMRFLLLLDEQLITTTFNGTEQPYLDINFHPGEDGAIQVDIPPLQPGIHDVILVGIANVDQEPQGTELPYKLEYRLTLVSGGENIISQRPYIKFKVAKRFWLRFPQDSGFPLALSLDTNDVLDWNSPDTILPLPLETPIDFYIYAGYLVTFNGDYPNESLAEKQPLALVMLVDYQPAAFSEDTPVIYGFVTPSTQYTRIPVHLLPPQSLGLHEITVLRITYPGFPMCLLRGSERIYPDWLYINRVGIKIEP